MDCCSTVLGTRGAVLHHSAETVLCFRIHVVSLFPQSISSGQRRPAYGVERAPCAVHNISCYDLDHPPPFCALLYHMTFFTSVSAAVAVLRLRLCPIRYRGARRGRGMGAGVAGAAPQPRNLPCLLRGRDAIRHGGAGRPTGADLVPEPAAAAARTGPGQRPRRCRSHLQLHLRGSPACGDRLQLARHQPLHAARRRRERPRHQLQVNRPRLAELFYFSIVIIIVPQSEVRNIRFFHRLLI